MVDVTGLVVSKGFSVVVDQVSSVTRALKARMQTVSENDDLRDHILNQADLLQTAIQPNDNPPTYKYAVDNLRERLSNCDHLLRGIAGESRTEHFLRAEKQKLQLEALKEEMEQALLQAQFAVICVLEYKVNILEKRLIKLDGGGPPDVYTGSHTISPDKLPRPRAQADGDHLRVMWTDNNDPNNVTDYEVGYYYETCAPSNITVSRIDRKKYCANNPTSQCFQQTFGPSKLHPGNFYKIMVRAVNGYGPGEWSDPTYIELPISPRDQLASCPSVVVQSATPVDDESSTVDVVIIVSRPPGQDDVTSCEIEVYSESTPDQDDTEIHAQGQQKWESDRIDIYLDEPTTLEEFKLQITRIKQGAHKTRIQVTTRSSSGTKSEKSKMTKVDTLEPIPSAPQNVRVAWYKSTEAHLTWEEPETNPLAVKQYKVWIRTSPQGGWNQIEPTVTTDTNATVRDLRSKKGYCFKVQAMTESGMEGQTSADIEIMTKSHPAVRVTKACGVFAATLAVPLVVVPIYQAKSGIDRIKESTDEDRKYYMAMTVFTTSLSLLISPFLAPVFAVQLAVIIYGEEY